MNRSFETIASLIIAVILTVGAGQAISRGDLFWTGIAAWAIAVTLVPLSLQLSIARPYISWLGLLITLPYLAGFVGTFPGQDPFQIASAWYWPLSVLAIFALSLVTMIDLDLYGQMKMNLTITMLTTFLLYESMIIIQGPIGYYSDLWLGTDLVPGNTELMVYVILGTVSGLGLTALFDRLMRRTDLFEHTAHPAEGGSP